MLQWNGTYIADDDHADSCVQQQYTEYERKRRDTGTEYKCHQEHDRFQGNETVK